MIDPALCSRVEDAGLNASAPPEQRWMDGWLLRFSPGKAKRARCINAVADGRLPLADRLERALAAYRETGLPPILRVTPFTQPRELPEHLLALGWRRFDDTRVMVQDAWAPLNGRDAWPAAPVEVDTEAFAEAAGTLRGSPPGQRQAHARRLQAAPVPARRAVVERDGLLLACGQAVFEGDVVGLYDIVVAQDARGQGIGGALCRWLLDQAAGQGARVAYLQVEADNAPARALYARLGFADAYAYHYLTPDPDVA